ncbi:hypothetical protein Bca4012_100899 [Brassica carinata]
MLEVVWTTEVFFRSGFDMQVFHIWKTSEMTYLLVVWKSSGSRLDFLEVFWTSRKSYGLPGSRLDFQEVVWTSRKSSGLPGSRLDFQEVVWTSRKSSGLPGSRLDFSQRFGFSDLDLICRFFRSGRLLRRLTC